VPKITLLRAGANDGVAALLDLSPNICHEFLYYQLQAKTQHLRQRVASGNDQLNLNTDLIGAVQIHIPPLPEQRKIAAILSTWDRAIELTEKVIAAKQQRQQALSQQLLTGRIRLPGCVHPWKATPISQFLRESRLAGSTGEAAKKITVKLYGKGVIPKNEIRQGSAETRYYRRSAGQFIYSKLDFLNGAFGIVPAHMDGYESTLDLPAFDVNEECDGRWLLYFVCRREFYLTGLSIANGGRKARRVNPADFLNINISAPSREEQSAIADFLDLVGREIDLTTRKLDALRRQKKGLMQQLLTGKVRVKVPADALEV
jgi:type I restriction enzyme S subunit